MNSYNPISMKLQLAKTIGESVGKLLTKTTIRCEEYEPRYKIDKNTINIYNFACRDEHGYIDTTDFIELQPTNASYNLIGLKSRSIWVREIPLQNKEKREIIINAIRKILVETNQAAESSYITILKDLSILVASDDWSDDHEIL